MKEGKPVRWSVHAVANLSERDIERADVKATLIEWEFRIPDKRAGKEVLMRRFQDRLLDQGMLLRVVIAETPLEIAVVTVYKTSQIRRYLRGLA